MGQRRTKFESLSQESACHAAISRTSDLVTSSLLGTLLWPSSDRTANGPLTAAVAQDAAKVANSDSAPAKRIYHNTLTKLENPPPLLADYPEFIQPVEESQRFEAPPLVDDEGADLDVRAWRFSYNARGIIEIPNRLRLKETAVIMVHPWGIDDDQGWRTPEPAGICDFCTVEKNHFAARHTR